MIVLGSFGISAPSSRSKFPNSRIAPVRILYLKAISASRSRIVQVIGSDGFEDPMALTRGPLHTLMRRKPYSNVFIVAANMMFRRNWAEFQRIIAIIAGLNRARLRSPIFSVVCMCAALSLNVLAKKSRAIQWYIAIYFC